VGLSESGLMLLKDPMGPGKRGFDLVFVSLLVALLSPVYLLICAAILVLDGWPIFYVQPRVGLHGKLFPFFKFRTMVVNAEKIGAGFEIDKNDARITRTGHFLRRWSLDELPQLFNVLRGEMSLIGPRPTLAYQVETYTERQRGRLDVRPGLTGLAQVKGRNALSWPDRIELDLQYIRDYSLALELRILFLTFNAVVNPDGIYGEGWAKKKGDPGFAGTPSEETHGRT
jgi:undecaprenyl phosphate N,N'-diacetylbacillosamine 1-phosphate transferase